MQPNPLVKEAGVEAVVQGDVCVVLRTVEAESRLYKRLVTKYERSDDPSHIKAHIPLMTDVIKINRP
jgi:hypothetical protein